MAKRVTIEAFYKPELDAQAYGKMKSQLEKVFSNAGINNSLTKSIKDDLEQLSKEAGKILQIEFDPKNPQEMKKVTKIYDDFQKKVENFHNNLNKESLVDALLPENLLTTRVKMIEKGLADAKKAEIDAFKEKTGVGAYRTTFGKSAENKVDVAEEKYNKILDERKAAQKEIKNLEKDLQGVTANSKAYKEQTKIIETKKQALTSIQTNEKTAKVELEKQRSILKEHVALKQRILEHETKASKEIEEATKLLGAQNLSPSNPSVGYTNIRAESEKATKAVQKTGEEIKKTGEDSEKAAKSSSYLSRELARVTSAAFLITKAFQGIRAAVKIVKDLDEAMTGIAVVTNQTREQVWGAYDSFKALADSLSATTQEIADAALLYYQQGLNTAEVMDVVKSTTIAAALAGIQFSEASDRMTAAIRGFDMEMSDSIHVTDTFSSLAAYTAADFNELSYAMTKTASIAHTANMSFENTTAFLAKMIETTREAPENIGTAMKSIVARMAELKKNPLQSLEDGTDFNRVETALRSVNIELRNSQNEMRAFDEIFIELGQKWDYIDRNTQSYIATMIAGNRQQSRFLALMSDFGRTMDMVDIANNSAGESMQMFNTYITGAEAASKRFKQSQINLANSFVKSDFIIGITDALTGFLNTLASIGPAATSFATAMGLLSLVYLKNHISTMRLVGSNGLLATALGYNNLLTKEQIKNRFTENAIETQGLAIITKRAIAEQLKNVNLFKSIALTKKKTATEIITIGTENAHVLSISRLIATSKIYQGSLTTIIAKLRVYIATQIASKAAAIASLGAIGLIIAALAALAVGIYKAITYERRHNEALKESITVAREKADAAKNENDSLKSLMKTYQELSDKVSLNEEEKEQLLKTEQELLTFFPELVKGYDAEGNAIAENAELLDAYTKKIEENNKARKENLNFAMQAEIELMENDEWGDLFTEEEEKAIKQAKKKTRSTSKGRAFSPVKTIQSDNIISQSEDQKINKAAQTMTAYGTQLGQNLIDGFNIDDLGLESSLSNFSNKVMEDFIEVAREKADGNSRIFMNLMDGFEGDLEDTINSLYEFEKIDVGDGNLFSFITENLEEFEGASVQQIEETGKVIEKELNNLIKAGQIDKNDPAVKFIFDTIDDKTEEAKLLTAEFEKLGFYSDYVESTGTSTLAALLKAYQESDSPAEVRSLINITTKKIAGDKDLQQSVEKAFAENDLRTIEGITNIREALSELGLTEKQVKILLSELSEVEAVDFGTIAGRFSKINEKMERTAELSSKMLSDGALNAEEIRELINLYPELAGQIENIGTGFRVSSEALYIAQQAYIQKSIAMSENELLLQKSQLETYQADIERILGKSINLDNTIEVFEEINRLLAEDNLEKEDLDFLEIFLSKLKDFEDSKDIVSATTNQLQELANTNFKNAVQGLSQVQEKTQLLNKAQTELNQHGAISYETMVELIDSDLLQYLDLTGEKISIAADAHEKLANAAEISAKVQLMFSLVQNLVKDNTSGAKTELDNQIATLYETVAAGKDATTALTAVAVAQYKVTHPNATGKAVGKFLEKQGQAISSAARIAQLAFSSFSTTSTGGSSSKSDLIEIDKYYKYTQALESVRNELEILDELEVKYENNQSKLAEIRMLKIKVLEKEEKAIYELTKAKKLELKQGIESLRAYGLEVEYNQETSEILFKNLEILEGKTNATAKSMYDLANSLKEVSKEIIENDRAARKIGETKKDLKPTFTELYNMFKQSEIDRLTWAQNDIEFLRKNDEQIAKWTKKIDEINEDILETKAKTLDITQAEKDALAATFDFTSKQIELLNEEELKYIEINRQIIEQKRLLEDLKNEKNKAIYYEDRGWVWEADTAQIEKGKEDLVKLEEDLAKQGVSVLESEIEERDEMYQESIDTIQDRIDTLAYEIEASSRVVTMSIDDLTAAMSKYGYDTKENLDMVTKSYNDNNDAIKKATETLAYNLETTVKGLVARLNSLVDVDILNLGDPATYKDDSKGEGRIFSTATGYDPSSLKPGDRVVHGGGITRINEDGSKTTVPLDTPSGKTRSIKEVEKIFKGMTGAAQGAVVDYTGPLAVHGSQAKSEVVFNSTDAKKLYDLVHNSPSLIPTIGTPAYPQTAAGGMNSTYSYNFDQLVLPNVTNAENFIDDLRKIRNIISVTGKN